jgi:chromosome segregation ATPase
MESLESQDALTVSSEERTRQLYDARAALSVAVSALTVELSRLRAEHDAAQGEIRALRDQQELQRRHIAVLEADLELMRNMKVVRWTKSPRAFVYRLRARRRSV